VRVRGSEACGWAGGPTGRKWVPKRGAVPVPHLIGGEAERSCHVLRRTNALAVKRERPNVGLNWNEGVSMLS
jgi:hypothetical protein